MKNEPGRRPPAPATIYYDDRCGLCQASIRFVQRHDHRQSFHFVSLHTPEGRAIAQQAGLDPANPGSLILQDAAGRHTHSSGICRIASHLSWPWRLLGRVARCIPRQWRDAGYRWFARNRTLLSD